MTACEDRLGTEKKGTMNRAPTGELWGGPEGGAPTTLAFQYALDPLRAASNDHQIG